jgi:putative membrane protein
METATFSWSHWHIHPSITLGVLLLAGGYLAGVGPLRQRYGWAERQDLRRGLVFGLGLLLLFLALQSPLHDLGDDYLFSAHMSQHMVLILAVAPLLLLGTPGWLLRPLLRRRPVIAVMRWATRPVTAIILFNLTLLLWHLPGPYESALELRGIHVVEHMLFLGTALLLWWPVLSPSEELPRLGPPGQMLYLFVQSLLPAVLGAFITFTTDQLYDFYAEAPRVYGISPVTDQQLGGLIMKIPGSLVFWGTITVIFFSWAAREEAAEAAEKEQSEARG